jgi:hypothetical protein
MDRNSTPTIGRRTFLTAGGAALAASLAGCTARFPAGRLVHEAEERRSFPASDVATLSVTNTVGDVRVGAAATDRVEVRVLGRARDRADLEDIAVEMTLEGGALSVTASVPTRRVEDVDGTPRADVTVTFPAPGPSVASLRTRAGRVSLHDARGDATLHADVGAVDARRVDGYLTLRTGLGEVTATDVTGIDRAVTDMGAVAVDVRGIRRDADVGTDWGEAIVRVGDNLDLDLRAEANGAVDCDLPLTSRTGDGRLVAGRLNRGGHRLRVFSELGEVSVRRLDR